MVKEWLNPLADPLMVEATIHVSYLVLPDNDLRVYEVTLAGTVMSAQQHTKENTHDQTYRRPCVYVCVCVIHTMEVRTTGIEYSVVCDEASAFVLGDLLPHQLCLIMSRSVFHYNHRTF